MILIGLLWILGIIKIFKEMKISHVENKSKNADVPLISSGETANNTIKDNMSIGYGDYLNHLDTFESNNSTKKNSSSKSNNFDDQSHEKQNINKSFENHNYKKDKESDISSNDLNKKSSVINKEAKPKIVSRRSKVSGLILINEEGTHLQEWNIFGKISVIIGKENKLFDVDVDLTKSAYAAFISDQHAVLNYSFDGWYIEDYYSDNGISIQKKNKSDIFQVSSRDPCKIDKGDIIYIANTKLLVV